MTTEGADIEPLIIDSKRGFDEWSPHNDTELLTQRTVLNLNNRHVRLTLWCLVYIVLTTTQLSNNMYSFINYDNMDTNSYWDSQEIERELQYYSLGISTNGILWWAAAILLCSFYCACCKMNCSNCCALLFVVGSVMQFATMVDGVEWNCNRVGGFNTNTDKDICRSLFIGSSIYFAAFSLYLAVDVIKSIGDDIRVRLAVKSILVALRSYLLFVYFNKLLDGWSSRYPSEEYMYRTLSGGNLGAGIICSIIILLVIVCNYGKDNKKLHPFLARLLAYFLLGATGSTLVLGLMYGHFMFQLSTYYVVAAVLIVYDLQYL